MMMLPWSISMDSVYLPEVPSKFASALFAGHVPRSAKVSATAALAPLARLSPSLTCERIV
jgi:hypothetical protein